MAMRGYKLQEFVAHSGSVNCLKIGKKNFRQFITGGDDQVVNLWSIGKPEPVTSLSGHTSPVESVAFDSTEVLVIAGASSGAIKLWDLEETKMVRTLSGHRSYCTAVEFHPFGEFFASGSMDTNLKIWDIRKKGCIHTYKGHTRGISTIRFTPDGRWVVSGGFDNVVKIWDLTAGKPLHDFKLHEGHIRSLDFHPLEFLLATGSADRTVKFWDLETFEMIGSARRENAGVRSIAFHPDGRTLFCGLDDSLKVYSWEPVICHDSIDMGWSTLGDLCVHDGKLLGGAYYQNSVAVWVADIAFIEPYGAVELPEQKNHPEQKPELQENASEKSDNHRRSNSSIHSISDVDSIDIKNIYVDTAGSNPITSVNAGSLNSTKTVVLSEKKETSCLSSQKQRSSVGIPAKTNVSASAKSFTVPTIIPRDIPEAKDLASSRRESFASVRPSTGMVNPSHVRKHSVSKSELDKKLSAAEPLSVVNKTSTAIDPKKDLLSSRLFGNNLTEESFVENDPSTKNARENSEKPSSLSTPASQENGEKAQDFNQGMVPVKVVNGVAVVRGRTRSLVDRFEKKEGVISTDAQIPTRSPYPTTEVLKKSPPVPDKTSPFTTEAVKPSPPVPDKSPHLTTEVVKPSLPVPDKAPHLTTQAVKPSPPLPNKAPHPTTEATKASPLVPYEAPDTTNESSETSPSNDNQLNGRRQEPALDDNHIIEALMENHDVLLSAFRSRLTKLQVVRHFWERKDVKGAINAIKKLPDHSVQADVISVLTEKMEIINLDLFSCLLPVLLGLLDSKVERHVSISLEMLLKLIAVFGSLVRSTVSAPRTVGVDLHAEERLASCKQCFVHLQNVQKVLPTLVQRGGVVARSALELNLVLQQS